jgi:hypothetical protein
MSQELSGTWYVYRYNLATPVLKGPETLLNIAGEDNTCRVRFRLKGQSQPVELTMTRTPDADASDWHGDVGTIDFQWAQVEPGMLAGQVFDRSSPGKNRDFFVAVRTRRTGQLPGNEVYTFDESYSTPFQRPSGKDRGFTVHLDKREIRFHGTIYKVEANPETYKGGLKLTGWHRDHDLPKEALRLWILPVDETGSLLATGYQGSHLRSRIIFSGSRPECQTGTTGISYAGNG